MVTFGFFVREASPGMAVKPGSLGNLADLRDLKHPTSGHPNYLGIQDFSQMDRIRVVKAGVPARLLTALASDMQLSRERLYEWLGIARATANRKIKADDLLSQDESERVLGIALLVGQVQKIVAESGDGYLSNDFDAPSWTAQWLARQNPALGGKPPAEFLDTADGRALVTGLVAQMQSGAYA